MFRNDGGYGGIFGVYQHIFVARARRQDVLERAQDGGVVTALLAWARQSGHIDGAVVTAVGEGDEPCFPTPKVATTVQQIKASASSSYCPNNLTLEEVEDSNLERVAFVGVPCVVNTHFAQR
ncbi:MAG: coenzyme F420 hydrogenase/dehydrogenase beta subunit N-terminal domain-containing protein [Pseudomonadota bacterium]